MKTSLFMTLLLVCYGLSAQNFTEVPSVLANTNLLFAEAEFADINGDGMQDLLVMGRIVSTTYTTKLFVNVGNANFFEIQNTPFAPVGNGDLAFADVNGDGSQDLLLSGQFNVWYDSTKLYLNDGTGNFSEVLNTPFANVEFSAVAFADVNGDGSQDLFITGSGGTTQSSNTRNARLYLNDGAGNFTEVFNTPFVPVSSGTVSFADVDNNGSQDVLISGNVGTGSREALLYLNDGSGNFSLVYNTPFVGVQDGSVEFLDANGNGSQDVIIIGRDKFLNRTATLYLNDGLGNFTIDSTASFAALSNDAIDIADVNGDGLEDVLVSGRTAFTERVVKLYVNDGSGNFVGVPNTPFPKISDGTVKFADVNGDGIQDVLLIGQDSTGTVITKLYTNNLDPSTSLPDLSPQDQFSFQLQPNPAEAQTVSINYRAPKAQRVHIHIHDLQGKLVHSTESILPVGEQEFPLDISNLRPGLYFVTASDGENQATQKLMIR